MYCPECGAKNDDQAIFCENCGARIQDLDIEDDTLDFETQEFDDTLEFETEDLSPDAEKATARKKGFTRGEKVELVFLLIAILAVALLVIVFRTQYSAQHIAEKYAKASLNGDWNTVYETMYLEEDGDFTTKEAFVTAQTIQLGEGDDLGNMVQSVTQGASSSTGQLYMVTYRTEDGGTDSMALTLKRHGLFWKVVPTESMTTTFSIAVPEGAAVTVDKISVSDQYLAETANGLDIYTITPIFGTEHYVETSGEEFEDTGSLLYAPDGQIALFAVQYSSETLESVANLAFQDLQEILTAAGNGQEFDDVTAFQALEDGQESSLDSYTYLRDSWFGYGNSYGQLSGFQLANPTMELTSVGDNLNQAVGSGDENDADVTQFYSGNALSEDLWGQLLKVQVKGTYDGQWVYEYNVLNPVIDEEGNIAYTLYYAKTGDSWNLYAFLF